MYVQQCLTCIIYYVTVVIDCLYSYYSAVFEFNFVQDCIVVTYLVATVDLTFVVCDRDLTLILSLYSLVSCFADNVF